MICPEELSILVSAAAVSLSKGRDEMELGILSAVFTQLGDTLATILAQRACIEHCCSQKTEKNQKEDIL